MSHEHSHSGCGCCRSMDRRDFMTTVGLSALAAQSGCSGLARRWRPTRRRPAPSRGSASSSSVPRTDRYWMGWPGACYDINGPRRPTTPRPWPTPPRSWA